MSVFGGRLGTGTAWTLGSYLVTQGVRFGTSVIVARLLAPELFGIMLIVNTLRTGAELLSDIGVAQGVVRSRNGDDPDFYNTAWTIQVIRGAVLSLVCALAAIPVAALYDLPILESVLPVAGLTFLISGLNSVAPLLLRRHMNFARYNIFEIVTALAFAAFQIAIAYFYPTVWALVFGLLFGSFIVFAGSYFLLPLGRPKLMLIRAHLAEITRFGKWVAVSSAAYFATSSFDRLYLAGALALDTLGIYGIARTMAEIIGALFNRLGNYVIFPFIASHADHQISQVRDDLAKPRLKFLLLSGLGVAVLASVSDVFIEMLFDNRYHSAGWMLALLAAGSWFSIMAALNEATLLGVGKSSYGAAANLVKLLWLLIALPTGLAAYGIAGAVASVAVADVFRYLALLFGQRRERVSFARHDLFATLVVAGMIALLLYARHGLGFPMALPPME